MQKNWAIGVLREIEDTIVECGPESMELAGLFLQLGGPDSLTSLRTTILVPMEQSMAS